MLFTKHFTVEEANALLPDLRRLMAEIHAEIERLEADEGSSVKAALEAIPTNGGGKKVESFFETSQAIQSRLQAIGKMGVQVKDLRRGLLDFPAIRNGEEILLCWLLEEPEVAYWHDLVTGFPGRRRIDLD
jgi:hypothetical protein